MLLAFEMSEFARELARAGIRKDHPEWSEWQVARELLRLAFLPEPLPSLGAMSLEDLFRRITSAFERADVRYMLTGSFAGAHYGVLRSTQDIDFVIEATPSQLRAFIDSLSSTEYYSDIDSALKALSQQSMFNVIDHATGWKIDLIIRKSRPFSIEEFGRRQSVDLHGVSLFVASAEDAILSKLEWAKVAQSRRQIEDAAAILRARGNELDQSYLEKWIKELALGKEWNRVQRVSG